MEITQYQIVLVNLDPTVGSEIKKTRPCVVVSPNEMNRHMNTIVVAPMTTSTRKYPTRVEVHHDKKKGVVAIDQIRTIDRQRVIGVLGKLTHPETIEVKRIIKEMFVD